MEPISLYDQKYYEEGEFGFKAEERSDHKRILELLKPKANDRVLEIGCGFGVLLKKISSKRKIGIESNDFAIEECKKRGLLITKLDVDKGLPFKNDSFNTIIMNEVVSHLKKPLFVLKECHRILKNGGKIIITAPVRSIFFHNISETHLTEMTVKEARQLIQKSGFVILSHEVSGISFLYPLLEYIFFKPFRLLRYFFIKNQKAAGTVNVIDSCHGLADKTFLKPINQFRKYFLKLGLQQLILAEKR